MKTLIVLISIVLLPFTALAQDDFCRGLADYDNDVDGTDAAVFKSHFGRSGFSDPCPPDGPAPVPKTGQTVCYDTDGNPRDCLGSGEDGEHQRGVEWPILRFNDNGDGTITDNLTGLMWLKDVNCMATNYPEYDNDDVQGNGSVTWQHALDFVAGINDGSYSVCGGNPPYNDWRLPNVKELISLLDYEHYSPTLPIGHPFINIGDPYYKNFWTSTTSATKTYARMVKLFGGNILSVNKTDTNFLFVWPVRGGH